MKKSFLLVSFFIFGIVTQNSALVVTQSDGSIRLIDNDRIDNLITVVSATSFNKHNFANFITNDYPKLAVDLKQVACVQILESGVYELHQPAKLLVTGDLIQTILESRIWEEEKIIKKFLLTFYQQKYTTLEPDDKIMFVINLLTSKAWMKEKAFENVIINYISKDYISTSKNTPLCTCNDNMQAHDYECPCSLQNERYEINFDILCAMLPATKHNKKMKQFFDRAYSEIPSVIKHKLLLYLMLEVTRVHTPKTRFENLDLSSHIAHKIFSIDDDGYAIHHNIRLNPTTGGLNPPTDGYLFEESFSDSDDNDGHWVEPYYEPALPFLIKEIKTDGFEQIETKALQNEFKALAQSLHLWD